MPRMKDEASRVDRRGSPGEGGMRAARMRAAFISRPVLLFAFAFAVMGDPVSSVAYSMEAGLRSLGGRLTLLLPTMLVVLAIVVLVSVNYHQLYAMFPEGGGDAAASAAAFSEGLAFLPLAALVVDYALTIAISVAAGASAIIAYLPWLAPARLLLAMVLLAIVAGLTLFGHGGRAVFAMMTVSFAIIGSVVILQGAQAVPGHLACLPVEPQPSPHALLGGCRIPRRSRHPGHRRRRSGTAPCPVLRGGGVYRLLVRAGLDGPPVPPGPAAVAHRGERYRRPGGRRDSDS